MVRIAAAARGAAADEYEFDSPSLHARKPQQRAQLLRPTSSGQRIGGVADLELKAQLAQAVFNFSETPSEHPLHGFTPDADGPAVTPIPVATSFRPPPAAAAAAAAPRRAMSAPDGCGEMPPPPTPPAARPERQMRPIHRPTKRPVESVEEPAEPAATTPSAAHLLKTRAARAALQTLIAAAQTPPATSAPCGLMWEPMETDDQVSVPMRVPKKTDNLPSTHKFEINDLLDEGEDPFGW